MELGAFSISLAVKNLQESRAFYEKLDFSVFGGDEAQNYLIMKNGDSLIGLFQNMFEGNILTFNPGWDQNAGNVEGFTDVRALHQHLTSQGIEVVHDGMKGESGPSSFSIVDPDGNAILIDQHV
ncbi:VOC family protein [Thalassomonas viridans]|uniref:VOC family protein n=1 Tax=Thalassomonas viridans TaxID=137584 RepID=A0AAF0CDB2_9GAMM|nr:VOC family protein [Thalassomonas viridans]WDE08475.1 VOC family protein [Thalassomonas viridans]